MSDFIEVSNISKTFSSDKTEVRALANTSFTTQQNEFVAIVGPSGCGKTTLLRILSGLTSKTTGKIFVEGKEVQSLTKFGMVFQYPVLIPWRRVIDNVLLPIDLLKLDRKQYLEPARDLMRLAGILGFEKAQTWELSGGMQQRVSICRSLITNPSVLLMDEPFGALDAFTRDFMNLELLKIWSEKAMTIFFITHDITEAVFLADRVLVMTPRPGRVLEIIDVDFVRPRLLELRDTVEFTQLTGRIRRMILSQFQEKIF